MAAAAILNFIYRS